MWKRAPRQSLYARSALFVALGCGTLLGALFLLSAWIVGDAERRILDERIQLARAAGSLIEEKLRDQLQRLTEAAQLFFTSPPTSDELRLGTLAVEREHSVLTEGVFILDARGERLATVPADLERARAADGTELDLRKLMTRARTAPIAGSELLLLGDTAVLMLLAPVRDRGGHVIGYAGGFFHPAHGDVFETLRRSHPVAGIELALVGAGGHVLASTDRRQLLGNKDHSGLLARAIEQRTEVRGRCHHCHEAEQQERPREHDVLAFAPLPTLSLGLGVVEPEAQALAPALALRRRLWLSGGALMLLFVTFAVLSVNSVARPIARLTHAVRRAEESQTALDPGSYGSDEIGELAAALELWRGRTVESAATRARQQQQEQLLRRVLRAQEEERTRVARDLHDTVAQDLSALRLEIERLTNRASEPRQHDALAQLEARSQEMLETVRRILLDLRLSILESMGLVPALRWLVDRAEREHGLRTHFEVEGDETREIGYEQSVTLFRILQEALLNVVEHARAEQVFVGVDFEPGAVELTIEDDGCGFDRGAAPAPDARGGLGLIGMEERARLLGGWLRVTSSPGEGTSIEVWLPLAAARSAVRAVA